MLSSKKYNINKQLLKVMSINSIGVFVRLISGFIISKIIAVFVGPQGLGIIGNLRSFLSSIQTISSFGFYNGIIKYTAEYKNDTNELKKVLSTIFYLSLISIIITSLVLYAFAPYWSLQILNSSSYTGVIKALSIGVILMTFDYFLIAILNGYGNYKAYTLVNILTTIASLIISLLLLWKYQLNGILYAIVIIPGLMLFITIVLMLKKRDLIGYIKTSNISWDYLKKLSEYSIIALLTAILIPPTLIAIRNHVVEIDGLTKMGYWEAMNRISNYYLMFVSSLLSLYLYPRLSSIHTDKEFKSEIYNFCKTLMPIVILGLLILYFFREIIIKILLSNEFTPMENLFSWQLFGDFFRILSLILAYQFMAKKMTLSYVITEVSSVIIWYLSSIYFIDLYGYQGAAIGYFVCYSSYFCILAIWFRKSLF